MPDISAWFCPVSNVIFLHFVPGLLLCFGKQIDTQMPVKKLNYRAGTKYVAGLQTCVTSQFGSCICET